MRLLPFLLILSACSEYGIKEKDSVAGDTGSSASPDILVQPTSLDFRTIDVGEASAAQVVRVSNVGIDVLHIDDVVLDTPGVFTMTTIGAFALAPEEKTDFTVTFSPVAPGAVSGTVSVLSDDPDEPTVDIPLTGEGAGPDIVVEPEVWDFGTVAVGASSDLTVTLSNVGSADLHVDDVTYGSLTSELSMELQRGVNGPLPWVLAPGASASVLVRYAPVDDQADEGMVTVFSDDPDNAEAITVQTGNGLPFEGFSTGWYVWDDGVAYETTSNPSHTVDYHGDPDLYWYEPSGAHGLVDSADPTSDFAVMRQYVLDRAGPPVEPTEPFDYDADSTLSTFAYATFTYFLCDFYLDPSDDPSRYQISSGTVDDGVQVMVNGEILGRLELGSSGSWPLSNAHPGEVNTLIVILVDDSAVDKYVQDLAFYRDGVMVTD